MIYQSHSEMGRMDQRFVSARQNEKQIQRTYYRENRRAKIALNFLRQRILPTHVPCPDLGHGFFRQVDIHLERLELLTQKNIRIERHKAMSGNISANRIYSDSMRFLQISQHLRKSALLMYDP